MELLINSYLLVGSFILLLSVLLIKSSKRFGLPILTIFLFVGMLVGSEGIGGIEFENYELTYALSLVALCLIIFNGGFETSLQEVKSELGRGISLATLGIILTTAFVGFFMYCVFSFPLLEALLFGAILSATDAAAVFAAFKDRQNQVSPRLKSLIKFESGSNDPMAYFLVAYFLGVIDYGMGDWHKSVIFFVVNPAVGLIGGWIIARLFIRLQSVINFDYHGIYPALTLAFLFLGYSVVTYFHGNGFLTVYLFGLMIGSRKIMHKRLLYTFYDGVSWLSQIGIFIMLGLLVFPSRLVQIAPIGIYVSLFVIFFARPLVVYLCLIRSRFSFKEKIFIAWAGLKGATPIVFACFAASHLGTRAHTLFDVVFFVVLLSALTQGITLKWVARKLKLEGDESEEDDFPVDIEQLEHTRNGILQIRIHRNDFAVGKMIAELGLPIGSLVLFIKRHDSFLVPDGRTVVETGDKILLVTKYKDDVEHAREKLSRKTAAVEK